MKEWLSQVLKLSFKAALVTAGIYLALSLVNSYFGPLRFSLNTKNLDEKNLFTVEGEGKVTARPDVATVSLGMLVQDQSVGSGQKKANEAINKLIKSLKDLGINEKDVQTTSYYINPNYDYSGGRQRLNGYTINIGLTVKVRDLEKINSVIDQATAQGINQVGGVSFDIENKEKLLNEARQAAVKSAQEKARGLAQAAGLKLGRVVNVREVNPVFPRPLMALSKEATDAGIGGESQVQPGSTEIKITVSLDYETL